MNSLRHYVCCLAATIVTPLVGAQEHGKPVVYLDVRSGWNEIDREAEKRYRSNYDVVAIQRSSSDRFTPPRGLAKYGLNVLSLNGICVAGRVPVMFIIDSSGRPENPVALHESNAVLAAAAIDLISSRSYIPATLNNEPIATIAATGLTFSCDVKKTRP